MEAPSVANRPHVCLHSHSTCHSCLLCFDSTRLDSTRPRMILTPATVATTTTTTVRWFLVRKDETTFLAWLICAPFRFLEFLVSSPVWGVVDVRSQFFGLPNAPPGNVSSHHRIYTRFYTEPVGQSKSRFTLTSEQQDTPFVGFFPPFASHHRGLLSATTDGGVGSGEKAERVK